MAFLRSDTLDYAPLPHFIGYLSKVEEVLLKAKVLAAVLGASGLSVAFITELCLCNSVTILESDWYISFIAVIGTWSWSFLETRPILRMEKHCL